MKKTLLVLVCLQALFADAQYSRVLIRFTDKNNNPYSLSTPQQFLSARAIQRRTRSGIPLDSTDLPIVPSYIATVQAQGAVTVLSQSKWLNQILIRTSDSATLQNIRALPFVRSTSSAAPFTEGPVPSATGNRRKFEPTREEAGATALPNSVRQTTADVYNYGNSYNQIHIHQGEYLHNKGYSGQGMIITVLDAGFSNYTTITAFDSIRQRGQVLGVRDFVAFDNSVTEDDAHGKNCLSIMAANWPGRMVGSAPGASFWLIRTEDAASEYPVEEHNWVVGAEFGDSCGTDLITSSLGYTTFDNAAFNHTYGQLYKNSAMVTMGASLAAKKGIIVTNSAGNDGTNSWRYLSFPADADSVCTVAAVDNAGTIAGFSSHGYPGKQKPNVSSVGSGTVIAGTTGPTTGSGTSYSNPNMAGLLACLWQAFPNQSNMKILSTLYASSSRSPNPDTLYGYGIPNMKTAYRSLKQEENQALYGSNWLAADPVLFADTVAVRFVSQVDGTTLLELINSTGTVVASQSAASEKEEVYKNRFNNLGSLPAGTYTVRYTDSLQTKTVQIQKNSVLPLTGLQATIRWIKSGATLEWTTLSESNTSAFAIFKSTDGTNFTLLKTVAAAGYSQVSKAYSYTDADADKTPARVLYYRIEGLDKDSRKTVYSTIRLLNRSAATRMALYPNPARNFVQILLLSGEAQPATIRLINQQGQVVKEQKVNFVNGSNTVNFPLDGVPPATYIIRVEAGKLILQDKLLVR